MTQKIWRKKYDATYEIWRSVEPEEEKEYKIR